MCNYKTKMQNNIQTFNEGKNTKLSIDFRDNFNGNYIKYYNFI